MSVSDTSEATDAASDDGPTTFESLPAELRNRIYDLSGCLRFYENRVSGDSICGACTTMDHEVLHVCRDRSSCAFAGWDNDIDWPSACHLVIDGHLRRLIFPSSIIKEYLCNRSSLDPGSAWGRDCEPEPVEFPAKCYHATGAQPALTKVSKQVRNDTLPIFYGNQVFVFRMMSADHTDMKSILAWLNKIGPVNASYLREVYIVYSKKSKLRFINKHLLSNMKKRGVKTRTDEPGVVRLLRTGYPYKSDDETVMELVRTTRWDEAKRLAEDDKKDTE